MKNIGAGERVVRIVIGLLVIGWGMFARNWWGAVGILPLFTGLIGWCGLYQIMGKCCLFTKKAESGKGDKPKSS